MRVVERAGPTTYFRYATNLSVGGVYFERTPSHQPGTQVTLTFIIPGDRNPASLNAEVVGEAGSRGMRLKFVDVDADTRARIAAYVDRADG